MQRHSDVGRSRAASLFIVRTRQPPPALATVAGRHYDRRTRPPGGPMNFDFSDDQKVLRDQARKFLSQHAAPARVRRILETDAPYDAELWRGMAEQGWPGTAIPESHGGAGFGYLELCVIAEELGRSLAPTPFSSSVYLVTEALLLAGSDAQKKAWLPKLAMGESIGCFAFARPIASFQAIKHKLVDMYVAIELARSNAYYAAWALSTGAPELPVAAAAARVSATEAFWLAAKENIQTHGGMGFTWEFDCHLYYRRAKELALVVGAAPYWKDQLIGALETRNAA